jgi:N-acetylmuramoyl-L-alanine amidase
MVTLLKPRWTRSGRVVAVAALTMIVLCALQNRCPAPELTGRKVVIDPGHGGSDPGATGYDGPGYPNEKDFTLAVGLKLRTLLQAAGCTVVMTRTTDTDVGLYTRRDIVNAENPHASLCIHCNSATASSAQGTETYWCLDNCNGDAAADQDLATKVQNRLVQLLGRPNRGVKRANFVMCSPVPPSCLGEMLFISNPDEFNLINTTAGQDAAAKAFLYATLDRVGVTAPSAPSGLTATAVSASQINLSWNDNSGIEDSYKIERALSSGGPWTEIATTAANTTSFADPGLSGGTTYYYRVRAFDSVLGNSGYSGVASATTQVSGAPSIVTQPQSKTVNPGSTVQFSVVASGNPPLSYQWRRNGANLANGGKFSGVNTATLTITNVQQTEAGNYDVVVSNTNGSVTSATAALAVNTVVAFFENFETGNLNNWSPISGATDLEISTAQNHTSGGSYSARVDISTDRMSRNIGAKITGRGRFTFWIYDSTQTRAFAEVRSYTGNAFGSGGLEQLLAAGKYNTVTLPGETYDGTKYQGRIANGPNAGWFNLNAPGAPNRSTGWHKFEIERLADSSTVNWYVDGVLARSFTGLNAPGWDSVVIGSVGAGSTAGEAWFDDILVEYYDPPVIVSSPASRTNAAGTTATFTVIATNTITAFQWRKNGVPLADGGRISGATTPTLTISNVTGADATSYDVVVSNGAGPAYSAPAQLRVSPAIIAQPASRTNVVGSSASFTVGADGQSPLSYRWRKNGVPLVDGNNITGATTDTLLISPVADADGGTYSVVVSNSAGVVTSAEATLTVAEPPLITLQPQSQTVVVGTTVTFTVAATGTPPLSYQWLFEDEPIPGATSNTLVRVNVQPSDAGNYSVQITNLAGIAISDPALLTVLPPTPIVLTLEILPDGRRWLRGSGDPGHYTIGASSELTNWVDVITVPNTNGGFEWFDTETNLPQRFYRARRE